MNVAESKATALSASVKTVFAPEIEELAKQRIADCLNATKRVRQRGEDGSIIYVDIPDHQLRGAMAVKVIEFNVGKAVSRSIVADVTPHAGRNAPGSIEDGLLALLLANPEESADVVAKLREAAKKVRPSHPPEIVVFEENPQPPEAQSVGSSR
jgi:hypothetical protein